MSESESLIAESVVQATLSGTLATMLMYGVTCMQAFHYWRSYEHDSKILKSVVAFVWILETAHTALSIHFVEYYLIIHFGDLTTLASAVWSMGATMIIGFIIGYVANLCFIWRISRCHCCNCSLRIWSGKLRMEFHVSWMGGVQSTHLYILGGWPSAFSTRRQCDCVYFMLLPSKTSHWHEKAGYCINTGAIGSLFAVLALIVFFVSPNTTAFIAFIQVQGKFYATSLLASLNSRKKLEQSVPSAEGVVLPLFRAGRPNPSPRYLQSIEVQKSITTEFYSDGLDPEMKSDETR